MGATTTTNPTTGVTVHSGPSENAPGKTNLVIYGPSITAVQGAIFALEDEYPNIIMTEPSPVGPKRYGAMGRGW